VIRHQQQQEPFVPHRVLSGGQRVAVAGFPALSAHDFNPAGHGCHGQPADPIRVVPYHDNRFLDASGLNRAQGSLKEAQTADAEADLGCSLGGSADSLRFTRRKDDGGRWASRQLECSGRIG